MRFFAPLVAAFTLTCGLAAAQEAVRFGVVNVNPTEATPGQIIQITYNSTLARHQPKFVDFYLQGQITANRPTPYILISRNEFGSNGNILQQDATVPAITQSNTGVAPGSGWNLWAFTTFDQDGITQVGGVAAGLKIN
ncbi:hypothetical protein PM082_003548 [Marasmius tenuissimus]|nr:hypothetical protein PM082_003548 [Marasmius tenuissimus]